LPPPHWAVLGQVKTLERLLAAAQEAAAQHKAISDHYQAAYLEVHRLTDDNTVLVSRLEQMELDVNVWPAAACFT
jgi:hypothetical protein